MDLNDIIPATVWNDIFLALDKDESRYLPTSSYNLAYTALDLQHLYPSLAFSEKLEYAAKFMIKKWAILEPEFVTPGYIQIVARKIGNLTTNNMPNNIAEGIIGINSGLSEFIDEEWYSYEGEMRLDLPIIVYLLGLGDPITDTFKVPRQALNEGIAIEMVIIVTDDTDNKALHLFEPYRQGDDGFI